MYNVSSTCHSCYTTASVDTWYTLSYSTNDPRCWMLPSPVAPRILKCEYCGTQSYCKEEHGKAFRCDSCGAPMNAGGK